MISYVLPSRRFTSLREATAYELFNNGQVMSGRFNMEDARGAEQPENQGRMRRQGRSLLSKEYRWPIPHADGLKVRNGYRADVVCLCDPCNPDRGPFHLVLFSLSIRNCAAFSWFTADLVRRVIGC